MFATSVVCCELTVISRRGGAAVSAMMIGSYTIEGRACAMVGTSIWGVQLCVWRSICTSNFLPRLNSQKHDIVV